MFKEGLSTSIESSIAILASMVCPFQHCLFNTHRQMLIFGPVYTVP